MNTCFSFIKNKIRIILITLNFVTFIIITTIMNKNSDDYNEYSTLSKYCSNCYIFIILLISLIHSINPKLICKMISHNLGILVCDKGKIIINLSLGILYLNNKNTPQLIFSITNFITSFGLFLCEFFHCTNSNNIGLNEEDNTDDKNSIDALNISNNNCKNKILYK